MSTIRIQPHKTLPLSVWSPGPWEITIGDRLETSKGFVEEFDYALKFRVGYQVQADMRVIEQLLGTTASRWVCAWAVADCPAAGVRLANSAALPANGNVRMEITIPDGIVAGELEVRRGLAFLPAEAQASNGSDKTQADALDLWHKPGSRLLEDSAERIRLEGGWSRFPTEAGSFSQMGLEDAAWTVSLSYDSPDDPFLGAVRLMINLDHPAGKAVINPVGVGDGPICLAALRTDVFRQLFQQLASDERFWKQRNFEPESIGAVAASMAEDTLNNDLPTVLMLVTDSPAELDRIIQERTYYLELSE